MKHFSQTISTLSLCLLISLLLVVNLIGPAAAQTSPTDRELFEFPETVDLFVAVHPDSTQAILLAPASGIEVMVLTTPPFEQIDQSVIDPSAWLLVDTLELWPDEVAILRTSAGAIVKLTHTVLSTGDVPHIQVTYTPVPPTLPDPTLPSSLVLSYYEGLDLDAGDTFRDPTVASVFLCDDTPVPTPTPDPGVIPEPGTGLLFLIGLLGLLGSWLLARRGKTPPYAPLKGGITPPDAPFDSAQDRPLKGGISPKKKWWLLLLFLSIVLLSVSGADYITAQQSCLLTVDKQGSGTGTVSGRGIDCGSDCTVSPLEGARGCFLG